MKHGFYLLAALALCACQGPAGNPGGQPYANAPGGVIAVKPEPAPAVAYDPNAQQPPTGDMQYGRPALNPSPVPVYQPPPR